MSHPKKSKTSNVKIDVFYEFEASFRVLFSPREILNQTKIAPFFQENKKCGINLVLCGDSGKSQCKQNFGDHLDFASVS